MYIFYIFIYIVLNINTYINLLRKPFIKRNSEILLVIQIAKKIILLLFEDSACV